MLQMDSIFRRKRKSVVRKPNGRKRRKLAKRDIASLAMKATNNVTVELGPVRALPDPADTRITIGVASLTAVARLHRLLLDMRRAIMK